MIDRAHVEGIANEVVRRRMGGEAVARVHVDLSDDFGGSRAALVSVVLVDHKTFDARRGVYVTRDLINAFADQGIDPGFPIVSFLAQMPGASCLKPLDL